MKGMIRIAGLLSIAGCVLINTPLAMAEDSGWYIGGNIGQSISHLDEAGITSRVGGAGLATSAITRDQRDIGYKLFGGYQINRNFALEGGYFDLGQFGFTSTTIPAGTLTGNLEVRGMNLDVVGILPITEQFSAFGRAGVTYARTRDNFSGTGAAIPANPNPDKFSWNPKYGLGLQYNVTQSFGIRAEAERYRINDAVGGKDNVDLFSLGLVYRFGKETVVAAAPVVVVEPEPVIPAPEPVVIPEPVVVAPPPVPQKTVFAADSSANSLFDFDKAILKPGGKLALDRFAADLIGASFDTMTVTGHADRIGSDAYNQNLSGRRADAVKLYLVESAGIPADKIRTIGAGESFPVTKREDCAGTEGNKLITCLAPDRRVEVEVRATRISEQ